MKQIPLTRGLFALVDDADFDWLNQWKWQVLETYKGCPYVRRTNHCRHGPSSSVLMHRLIMNAEKGQILDHINCNSLDNRRENLRFCDSFQNLANRPLGKNNSSGFKGVSFTGRRGNIAWGAWICCRGNRKFIGTFPTAKDAAAAYDNYALQMHGEFARTNKILGLI